AYGRHLLGLGTDDTIRSVTRDELLARYQQGVRPEHLAVFVVGDFARADVVTLLTRALGGWNPAAARKSPEAAVPAAVSAASTATPKGARVVLVDRPHATQSYIVVGRKLSETSRREPAALYAFNEVMGGNFVSRLNLNLRQQKGW